MQFETEKISFEELIQEYTLSNLVTLKVYLKEVWRDLSERSSDKNEGINRVTFSKYYELPGLISDRIFMIFDKDKNNFLSRDEFIQGMLTIFSLNFNKLTTFIFKIYDFENIGYISREDVRTILSYITINSNSGVDSQNLEKLSTNTQKIYNSPHSSFKFERETFQDRLESQEELHSLLDKCFKFEKKIDFSSFIFMIENVDSNIFLYLLIFLLDKKPFRNKTLDNYKFIKDEPDDQVDNSKLDETDRTSETYNKTLTFKSINDSKLKSPNLKSTDFSRVSKSPSTIGNNSKLLASPTLLNKFLPTQSISKSPTFMKKRLNIEIFETGLATENLNIKNEGIGNSFIKNSLMKFYQNSSKKPEDNMPKKITEDENSSPEKRFEQTRELTEIKNVPFSRSLKKSFNDLNENKNLFLQHLNSNETERSNNFDDSDVSSNVSNIDIVENENFLNSKEDNLKENEIFNSDVIETNCLQNTKNRLTVEKKIDLTKNNLKINCTNTNNKLLNLENLKKSNASPHNKNNCSEISSPNSSRSNKLDDNQLYPSKKYENDINYLNQKIFQASLINKKLTQEKKNEKNNSSNKNITLKIPENLDQKDVNPIDKTDKKIERVNLSSQFKKDLKDKCNNLGSTSISNISSNSSLDCNSHRDLVSINSSSVNDLPGNQETICREGYLCKITYSNKLKKLFFKLSGKDFYYYKSNKDEVHKGMHNITGVFIREEKKTQFEGIDLYCFSLIYPYRVRKYYSDSYEEYKKWLADLKKVIGYETLEDQYELKEVLGKGKFGLVKLAIHKSSGRKVAVKIIGKKNIDYSDLEMIKNEIEILKVCQHPHIVKLYDVFENSDYIYLITEFLEGGDLFTYLQKRNFRLPEQRVANLIHQICIAVYYLNSYGIIHRDLKPENLVMTDNTEEAQVKILDFGLSKIIGPNELCHDPYGTIAYCAPEILLDQFYGKKVDSWSIGVITYLMLCGFLPFDHDSSIKEIARKTVQERTPFPIKIWKDFSDESRKFTDGLLSKEPDKRLCVSDALEHPWFRNHISRKLTEIRKFKKKGDKFVFDLYTSLDGTKN